MIGENDAAPINQFSPESEAKELLQLMAKSGVLPEEEVNKMLDEAAGETIVDAEVIELPLPDDEDDID